MALLCLLPALGAAEPIDFAGTAAPTMTSAKKSRRVRRTPLALAVSLAFDTTTWARVGVSTSAPSVEMSRMLRGGYYRLEIVQLVLMASESGKRLELLTARRDKGESLREIAKGLSIDYDRLYGRARDKGREVRRRLRSLSSVRVRGKRR